MERYFALVLETQSGQLVYVDTHAPTVDTLLKSMRLVFDAVDHYEVGHLKAGSENEAIDKVRRGEWESSRF